MVSKRILVVEDEVIVAMTIEDSLANLGYTVAGSVTNGPDAIQTAGEVHPDLVLMDIRLDGEMDGIEAAQRIEALYDIPVIYLTAHSDETTLSRAIATQPYGYLFKPFRERELYTNIEMAFHKHRVIRKTKEAIGEGQKAAPVPGSAEQQLTPKLFDAIGIPLLVVDDGRRVVFYNDPFARLFADVGTGFLRPGCPVYEIGPKPLVGTARDYEEITSLRDERTNRMPLNGTDGSQMVEIRRIPIEEHDAVRFVATMVMDVSHEAMLEWRGRRLERCYDEVVKLLGDVSKLQQCVDTQDIHRITGKAEHLVIALSKVESGWMKYNKQSRQSAWKK